MNEALVQLAMTEAPSIIAALKAAFKKQNPNAPQPTDADAHVAYLQALSSSLAKDARWLAANPE